MSFTWPLALLLLLAVPLLLGVYALQIRRKRRQAVRFSSIALIRAAMPSRPSWRRHLPAALFLLALTGLGVASARPQISTTVPLGRTSIIMALDVSRSMCATDVEPNRLAVAQEAARKFIEEQPKGTRIGIVVFAGFAEVVVPPTTDRGDLIAAVDGLTTSRGTAIGAATLKSLDAIAAVNPDVAPVGLDGSEFADEIDPTDPFGADPPASDAEPAPSVPKKEGEYVPDIVVLLTDGANNRGIEPVEAAKQAVERRVRVYTIGFGTTNPTAMVCTPQQLGGEAFGGGFGGGGGGGFDPGPGGGFDPGGGGRFGGGRRQFLVIDEPTLTEVADMTGGKFYKAEDADQLQKVFAELPRTVELQKRKVEISAAFAGLGAVLAAAGMVLSLLWNRTP